MGGWRCFDRRERSRRPGRGSVDSEDSIHFSGFPIDSFLRWVLALTLLGVAIFLPFVGRIRKKNVQRSNNLPEPYTGRKARFVALGAGVGFMVALTSVGSAA